MRTESQFLPLQTTQAAIINNSEKSNYGLHYMLFLN